MEKSEKKSVFTLGMILVSLLISIALGIHYSFAGPLLPLDMVIAEIFKPGNGMPVGEVHIVQGEAVIQHEDIPEYFRAKKGMPLFKEDTIITRKKGRIRFELSDGSILTLASETKLVINRTVYDPTKKSRSSFLSMSLGKARFWVKKLKDFKNSEFRVKTKTAVVGVRGSDFIIEVTSERTEVDALENTKVEVVSLAELGETPHVITDFERIVIEEGKLPSQVESLFPDEVEIIKDDFTITPEMDVSEISADSQMMKEDAWDDGIHVSEDDLVSPEGAGITIEDSGTADDIRKDEVTVQAEDIFDDVIDVSDDAHNEVSGSDTDPLPDFPLDPSKPDK